MGFFGGAPHHPRCRLGCPEAFIGNQHGLRTRLKLNQNGADSARLGAAAGLAAGGTPGVETAALAALMREADDG